MVNTAFQIVTNRETNMPGAGIASSNDRPGMILFDRVGQARFIYDPPVTGSTETLFTLDASQGSTGFDLLFEFAVHVDFSDTDPPPYVILSGFERFTRRVPGTDSQNLDRYMLLSASGRAPNATDLSVDINGQISSPMATDIVATLSTETGSILGAAWSYRVTVIRV